MKVDVAIIGGGFAGSMVLAHLAERESKKEAIIIDPSPDVPRGAAYSTTHEEHLLNVPAARMGAFADDVQGFHDWCVKHNEYKGPGDFVPRRLYGDYLEEIYKAAKPTHLRAKVERIEAKGDYVLHLSDGSQVQATSIVLATGNPFVTHMHPQVIAQPWRFDFASLAGKMFNKPILIAGSGLTAVDTLLSLRKHKVDADILIASRHGLFPQPHSEDMRPIALSPLLFEGQPLPIMLYRLRAIVREVVEAGHSWQSVIDALRPHTQALWSQLPLEDKKRFIARLKPYWDSHRHRMAPSIAVQLQEALASGRVKQVRERVASFDSPETNIADAALLFDCTGPRLSAESIPVLLSLVTQNIIAPSPTGAGLVMHAPHRVSKDGFNAIYAIGPLLIGEWLETTAVPELRAQAKQIASLIDA